jgi:hypothetical protein
MILRRLYSYAHNARLYNRRRTFNDYPFQLIRLEPGLPYRLRGISC